MANMTYDHKLVEKIGESGRFWVFGKGPVGIEGYDVVVLKKVGKTGTQYYCTLKPGEMTQVSLTEFRATYQSYAVDVRPSRMFEINQEFVLNDKLTKVGLHAKVLYRVIDARKVGIGVEDPLGKFSDKIIGLLKRQLGVMGIAKLNEITCENIIRSVGHVDYLGLAVESVDYVHLDFDKRVLEHLQAKVDLEHKQTFEVEQAKVEFERQKAEQARQLELEKQKQMSELESMRRQHEVQLELERQKNLEEIDIEKQRELGKLETTQERIQQLDMTNQNVFMHLRPDLVPEIMRLTNERDLVELKRLLQAEDSVQGALREVVKGIITDETLSHDAKIRMIRDVFSSSSADSQVQFENPTEQKKITFGSTDDEDSDNKPAIQFGKEL